MIHESSYYNPNYLAHFGVKGMKWGVRKYQNPDGSLTAAGQKRYYNSDGSLTKKGQKSLTAAGQKRYYNSDGSLTKKGQRSVIAAAAIVGAYGLYKVSQLPDVRFAASQLNQISRGAESILRESRFQISDIKADIRGNINEYLDSKKKR